MDLNSMSTLGFLAPFALFFQQVRGFLLKFFHIFWKDRTVTYDFAESFYFKLAEKSRMMHFDDYILVPEPCFSIKHKVSVPVLFKMFKFEIALYKGFVPIFLVGKEAGELSVQYLKFTFPFEKLFTEVAEDTYDNISKQIDKKKRDRFFIELKRGRSLKPTIHSRDFTPNTSPASTDNSAPAPRPTILNKWIVWHRKLNGRILGINPNELHWYTPDSSQNKYQITQIGQSIISQVNKWLNSEVWYSQRNIAWRRGILLHGKPGNGKSSMVLETARRCGIPLFVFDLSSMDNAEFDKALQEICSDSAIILFEDLDVVFNGRKNLTRSSQYGGLTFDFFINKLSGVNSIKNKFIFVTTNNLENVDSAIKRPGRIDEIIEIPPLTVAEKTKLATAILDKENISLVVRVVEEGINDTAAEFENRCIQTALENLWDDKKLDKIPSLLDNKNHEKVNCQS